MTMTPLPVRWGHIWSSRWSTRWPTWQGRHRLIRIDLVFDPPWGPDMISEEGRSQLGWIT